MSITLKPRFTWQTITTAGWAGHGATPPQATCQRNFMIGIPPNPPSPVNVIIDCHGGGSTPWKWFGYNKSTNSGDQSSEKYGEFPWDMWWTSLGYQWIVVAPLGAGLDQSNHTIKTTSDLTATPTDVAANTSWNAESTGVFLQGTPEIVRMYDRQFIFDILNYIEVTLGYTVGKVCGHGHSKGAIFSWTQFCYNDLYDFVCVSAGCKDNRAIALPQNNPKPFALFIGDLDGYVDGSPGSGVGWPNGGAMPSISWFHYPPLASIQELARAAGCTDVDSSTSIVCNTVDPTTSNFSANQTVVTGGRLIYSDSKQYRILYTGGLADIELGILRNEPHNISPAHRLIFSMTTDFIARQFGDK